MTENIDAKALALIGMGFVAAYFGFRTIQLKS